MRIRYRSSSRIVPTQARKVMMAAAVIGGCGSDLLAGMSYVNSVPAGYFKACSDAGETADGGTAAPYVSEWLTSTADEEGSCRDGGVVVTS
jgi:hypothetical protein